MALFNWKESYSVGNTAIDNQHKKLIGYINDFYDSIKSKTNNELISKLIKDMKEYTVFHFKYEEKHLERLGYSELPEHKLKHADFINKVTDFETRLLSNKIILSFEITSFLKDWLKHHILEEDMAYSHLFKTGIKPANEVLSNKRILELI